MKSSELKRKPEIFDAWFSGLLAIILAFIAAAISSWRSSADSWSVFLSNTQIIVTVILAVLLTCLAIIWTAIVFGILHRFLLRRRSRIIVAISPFLLLLTFNMVRVVTAPPTPHAFFERYIGTTIPADATNIQIRPPNLADPGHVGFYFESNPSETNSLIHRLQLAPFAIDGIDDAPIRFRIPGIAEPNLSEFSWFSRIDPSGTGFVLATKDIHVFLARDPLYAKSEDELNSPNTPP
jgi:hypothetical protein